MIELWDHRMNLVKQTHGFTSRPRIPGSHLPNDGVSCVSKIQDSTIFVTWFSHMFTMFHIKNMPGWCFFATPLKNMKTSVGMMTFPKWWESHKIYVPKHHPTIGVYLQLGNSEYLGFSHDVHEINHPAVKHGETPLPPSRPNSSVRTSASFRTNLSINFNWKDFHQHTMIYQLILDQFII